ATADPFDRKRVFRDLAKVHEEGRHNPKAAFEAFRGAFAEDSADESLADDLERLASTLGRWDSCADVFAGQAGSILDPQIARGVYGRIARIAETHLRDPGRAIQACLRAIEQVGDDEELLETLDRLYGSTAQWRELAEVLERRLGHTLDNA